VIASSADLYPSRVRVRVAHGPTGLVVEAFGPHVGVARARALARLRARLAAPDGPSGDLVRDYSDWTDGDWVRPEDRLRAARSPGCP